MHGTKSTPLFFAQGHCCSRVNTSLTNPACLIQIKGSLTSFPRFLVLESDQPKQRIWRYDMVLPVWPSLSLSL